MEHTLYYMSAAAVLLLAAGCAKERAIPVFATDDRAIRIVPEISSAFTKPVPTGTAQEQTSFNAGDLICLSCEDGSMLYEYSGSVWTPTDNWYLRWGEEPVTYDAYYPASEGSASAGFTVSVSQRNAEALKRADYMTCTVKNAVRSENGELRLPLERRMARIVITAEGMDAGSRIQAMRISSGQGITGTDISSTRIFVNPYTESPASGISGQEGTVYTAIVTPSEERRNEVFATFVYGGKGMTAHGIPQLEAGKEYRLTMDMSSSAISFTDPADGDWSAKITVDGGIQTVSDTYFIKPEASGDGSGTDWDNAMDMSGFAAFIGKVSDQDVSDSNAGILDGATIYMAGGDYDMSENVSDGREYLFVEYSGYSRQVKITIMGGYDPAGTGTDISGRDISLYETTISGNGKTGLFNFGNQTDVTFDGITFADGHREGSGPADSGGISVSNGSSGKASVTLNDCIIRDCFCQQGAAITCYAGTVRLDNVLFTGNSCDSRGIIKLTGNDAVIYANDCIVHGNRQSGSFGYAFHVSAGHLCMNNTVISGNKGSNGAVNGAGSICLVNSTIISDNTGGAIRCESASSKTSMLMNCIVINEMSGQNAVDMSNNTGYLTSRGYNMLGSGIKETNGTGTQFIVNPTDTGDCSMASLGLVFDASLGTFTWDGTVSSKTTADDIKAAIRTFRPEGQTALGENFISWLESIDGFGTDICGNARDTGAMWPGAYQKD